jgi:hypothetical protein
MKFYNENEGHIYKYYKCYNFNSINYYIIRRLKINQETIHKSHIQHIHYEFHSPSYDMHRNTIQHHNL